MEIQYRRSYTPRRGRGYSAGEIPAMLGYALEIVDPRAPMAEGRLEPGEACRMLFGVTAEEYAWRESDPKKLDALAAELRRVRPADRLIGWQVCDLKGAVAKRALKPQTGESVDGGAFVRALAEKRGGQEAGPLDAALLDCARLQKLCAQKEATEELRAQWQAARRALGAGVLSLERAYVADEALMGGRFPCVGFDGHVELFTLRSRADRAAERVAEVSAGVPLWQIRALSGGELEERLRRMQEDGFTALRVDNGFASAELALADVMELKAAENAALRALMLREVACGARWKRLKEVTAPERNQRGALEGMLTLRNFAWRELGNARLYLLAGEGGRGYVCVNATAENRRMLATFTSRARAEAFAGRMADRAHAVSATFDEATRRAGAAESLLIDPDDLGYRLPRTEFERVRELRAKPPLAVRIQPKEAEAPKRAAGMANSLPNPDEMESSSAKDGREVGSGSAPAEAPKRAADMANSLPNPDELESPAAKDGREVGSESAQKESTDLEIQAQERKVGKQERGFFRFLRKNKINS